MDINRRKAEVEAESYAYVVSYQLGLDTLSYSFGYVASYSNGKLQTLNTSLERIKNTSQAPKLENQRHLIERAFFRSKILICFFMNYLRN